MSPLSLIASVLALGSLPAAVPFDGDGADDADVAAIRAAALDYVDGYYDGDVERIERGVHPSLQKVRVGPMPGGRETLQSMDRETLLEYARLAAGKRPPDQRAIEVSVLATYRNIAAVRIAAADFVDLAHVARVNDKWRVVNVLWAPRNPAAAETPSEEDRAAIERAGLDYVDGFLAGSAERLERALHPRLQKVMVQPLPNGREVLRYASADGLAAYAASGAATKPEAERHVEVALHGLYGNVASVRIDSADFVDLAHVARIDGEWVIVNVLWAPRRD